MNKATVRLLLIFLVVLMGSALLVYLVLDRVNRPPAQVDRPAVSQTQPDNRPEVTPTPNPAAEDNPFLAQVLGSETRPSTDPLEQGSWGVVISRIFLRFRSEEHTS